MRLLEVEPPKVIQLLIERECSKSIYNATPAVTPRPTVKVLFIECSIQRSIQNCSLYGNTDLKPVQLSNSSSYLRTTASLSVDPWPAFEMRKIIRLINDLK